MPFPLIRLRFLALALVAVAAACGAHQSGGMLPSSQAFLSAARATATPKTTPTPKATPTPLVTHAPCVVPSGYKAPLSGKLVVLNAFGELQESNGVRYAQQGVDLTTRKGDLVRATTSGRLTFVMDPTYGKSALVTEPNGAQTFYGLLENSGGKLPKPRKIKAGEALGRAGGKSVHYEITNTLGRAGGDAAQMNPCGDADGASGTISIVPSASGGINVEFTALGLDGTPLPSPSPGVPLTPATMTVAHIVKTGGHAWNFSTLEYGPVPGAFYIVLCGNVVFQTGDARSSVLVPYPSPTGGVTLPQLVFFRDPGNQGADLTGNLSGLYPAPCPAPAPPYGSGYNLVFGAIGQEEFGVWTNPVPAGAMTMTVANPSVATVSPNPAPVEVSATYPPAPGTFYTITAAGVGTTQITVVNTVTAETPGPFVITVRATPSPAPNPTPMPNVVPTASPTPKLSPTPTASPTP